MDNNRLLSEQRLFRKHLHKKILATICMISVILVGFVGCTSNTPTEIQIRIGITGVPDVDKCEVFLEEEFEHIDFEFVELGSGDGDAFSNVCHNIEQMFLEKKLDMIIGIPEDYVCSLSNDLFLNLHNKVDIDNLLPAVKGHLTKQPTELYYVTHSLYCIRFLVANIDLLNALNIDVPDSFESISDLTEYAYAVQEEIEKSSLQDVYAISFGSPIDEFLFDDIANLLLPLGYPRTEEGQQSRFTDEAYVDQFKEIFECALTAAYDREDIGHQYTSDFYFSTGNVALKCASAYEMRMFNNSQSNAPYNPYIDDFAYKVIPLTEVLNSQSTVNAISAYTENHETCLEVVKFLLSEKYASDVLNNISPFLNDACSFPCVFNEEIEDTMELLYGVESLQAYTDHTYFSFAKDSDVHWSVIQQEQQIFQNAFDSKLEISTDEVLEELRKITG